MKKRIIVVSLILIVCSIFLFSKDTIMSNIKKLTADVTASSNNRSAKPAVLPNVNDIDVYMFCDSYTSSGNHYGHAGFLSNHTDKWSLGEIVPCDWMDGYDWFCPLNMTLLNGHHSIIEIMELIYSACMDMDIIEVMLFPILFLQVSWVFIGMGVNGFFTKEIYS